MGHYDDIYDRVKCKKCKGMVDKYGSGKHYITEYYAEILPSFQPYVKEYLCNICYSKTYKEAKDNKEFATGEIVEIRFERYEFYLQGRPTGQYARGEIIKLWDNNHYVVKLLCSGELHNVEKQILFTVK